MINRAQKWAPKIDERFKIESLTTQLLHNDYDFDAVGKVNIYSFPLAPLNNYNANGTGDRYGEAYEQQDEIQTLDLTQDKSMNITIDMRNFQETGKQKHANKIVKQNIDEVLIPYIDTYRFSTLAAAAVAYGGVNTTSVTKDNAYELFLGGRKHLVNKKVPKNNRFCVATADFINKIQLDPRFNLGSDKAQESVYNGFAGKAAGVTFIEVPDEYLPSGVHFILTHPSIMCSPRTLSDHVTHKNPPGLSGWKIELRDVFDAFVSDRKKAALYIQKNP